MVINGSNSLIHAVSVVLLLFIAGVGRYHGMIYASTVVENESSSNLDSEAVSFENHNENKQIGIINTTPLAQISLDALKTNEWLDRDLGSKSSSRSSSGGGGGVGSISTSSWSSGYSSSGTNTNNGGTSLSNPPPNSSPTHFIVPPGMRTRSTASRVCHIDGFCRGRENCDTCRSDCKRYSYNCGDGICVPGENCLTCPQDCAGNAVNGGFTGVTNPFCCGTGDSLTPNDTCNTDARCRENGFRCVDTLCEGRNTRSSATAGRSGSIGSSVTRIFIAFSTVWASCLLFLV